MTVYCEDCTHANQRTLPSFKWLCGAYKKEPEPTYIKKHETTEPMMRCVEVQRKFKGECPYFEKLKGIENDTDISGS